MCFEKDLENWIEPSYIRNDNEQYCMKCGIFHSSCTSTWSCRLMSVFDTTEHIYRFKYNQVDSYEDRMEILRLYESEQRKRWITRALDNSLDTYGSVGSPNAVPQCSRVARDLALIVVGFSGAHDLMYYTLCSEAHKNKPFLNNLIPRLPLQKARDTSIEYLDRMMAIGLSDQVKDIDIQTQIEKNIEFHIFRRFYERSILANL